MARNRNRRRQDSTPVEFNPMKDIREFHVKFGLEYEGRPRSLYNENMDMFRFRFLVEELDEYQRSIIALRQELTLPPEIDKDPGIIVEKLGQALDALVDLTYVAMGTAYLHGFDFEEAWRRVHEANMRKVRVERPEDSKRGSGFDVIKPDGWEPPDHSDLVEDHAHSEDDE
jgi:predicted HAD superfamily Cof-like phosphohydrolase